MFTQSESVVHFTTLILADRFQSGTPILSYITKDEVSKIVDAVTRSIMEGETDLSPEARIKYSDPRKLRSYVVGMVNNWHRKHKALNGGTTYVAKNPGSRSGSTDPQLKELRLLLKVLQERNAQPESLTKVEAAIAKRIAELTPKTEVDLDLIPEELRDLL